MITAIPNSWRRRSISRRIWAWVVTSSAVVGSSAISSFGSLVSAIAIIARWRMPPENSCGYSPARRSGSGIPTRPRSSTRARHGGLVVDVLVHLDRLDELLADLVEGVQRGERVLEDHRDLVAADLAQLVVGHLDQVRALEHDPAGDLGVRRPGSARGSSGWRRSCRSPDSPTIPSVSPLLDLERDAVDGLDDALVGVEVDLAGPRPRSSGSLTGSAPAGRGRRRRCRRSG